MQTNSADRRYWDEHIETMSLADLNRLEAPLIAEQIAYVYATSAYYRAKFDAAGVRPDKVTSVEALEAVPFTEKSDITSAQRDGALFGPHQCAPYEDIVRVVATGGTSGQPTRIGWTSGDADLYNEMGARALWANGWRQGDFVVNCFNYSLYAGGIMDHMAFEALGAGILPYGVGRSELVFTTLKRRACPLIRLRTHDTVRVFTHPCACGRTSFRFHVLGRSDDMFIVKGMNIFPLSVQESLLLLRPEVTGEFFIVLDKEPPIDYSPRICVEIADGLPPARMDPLKQELIAAIQRRSNFTPALEFVPAGSIASEHKTRRLYRAYAGVTPPALGTFN